MPAYARVADELRRRINAPSTKYNDPLPTEAELATSFGVSRQTIRRAFEELTAEGLVVRTRGRGTFALPRHGGKQYVSSFGGVEDLMALSIDTTMEVLEPLHSVNDPEIASILQLGVGSSVLRALIVRYFEDTPICVTRVNIPSNVAAPELRSQAPTHESGRTAETFIGLIDGSLEGGIAGATQEITAILCPSDDADLLEEPPHQPVLRISRLYYDVRGRPVEYAVSIYSNIHYRHRLELRRRFRG